MLQLLYLRNDNISLTTYRVLNELMMGRGFLELPGRVSVTL